MPATKNPPSKAEIRRIRAMLREADIHLAVGVTDGDLEAIKAGENWLSRARADLRSLLLSSQEGA